MIFKLYVTSFGYPQSVVDLLIFAFFVIWSKNAICC